MTGTSENTGLAFNEAHPEVNNVRGMFLEWLRTVYSKFVLTVFVVLLLTPSPTSHR